MGAPLFLPGIIRTTQPQKAAQVDWSNSITKGLFRLANAGIAGGNSLVDAVDPGVIYAPASSPSLGVNVGGRSLAKNSIIPWESTVAVPAIGAGDFTIFFAGVDRSNSSTQYFASIGTGANTAGQAYAGNRATSVVGLNVFTGTLSVSPVAGHVAGRYECSVITRRAGVIYFWTNGVYLGSSANTSTIGSFPFSVGQPNGNSREVNVAGLFLRGLIDDEARSLSANPYQLIKSPQRVMMVSAGAATYTLTAASGAIALSGSAASLLAGRKLAAQSGALAMVGGAAGLTAARKMTTQSGAVALTGNAAGLIAARRLTANTGSTGIYGADAGLLTARRLSAATGSIPITGGAAALRADRVLSASSGAIAITGGAANLVYTPISGTTYTLSCGSGAIPISGGSASLIVARKLVASSGALAIAGGSATFARGMDIVPVVTGFTIMRESVANSSIARLVDSIAAQGGILGADISGYTIMRASVINSQGRMRDAAINCTASFL